MQDLSLSTVAVPSLPATEPEQEALLDALRALESAPFEPVARLQAHAEVARQYRLLGAPEENGAHLAHALRWARLLGAPDSAVELLCELAELAIDCAQLLDDSQSVTTLQDIAREHCFEAATLARRLADAHWEVQVLLRISDALERTGDRCDAISLQCRALQLLVKNDGVTLTTDGPGEAQLLM